MIDKIQAFRTSIQQNVQEWPSRAREKAQQIGSVARQAFKDLAASLAWWHAPALVTGGALPFAIGFEVGAFSLCITTALVLTHIAICFFERRKS